MNYLSKTIAGQLPLVPRWKTKGKIMKHIIQKTRRSSWVILALLGAATVGASIASAQTVYLQGIRWEQPTVTYWITVYGASAAAKKDVEAAIADWTTALALVADAPALQPAASAETAHLRIDLRANCGTRRGIGAPHVTGVIGYVSLSVTSGCVLESQDFVICGDALRQKVPLAGTRNVARHLLGLGMGLSYSDCATDVMNAQNYLGGYSPTVDLEISDCDLAGIDAIYSAPSCEQIPPSITCPCP